MAKMKRFAVMLPAKVVERLKAKAKRESKRQPHKRVTASTLILESVLTTHLRRRVRRRRTKSRGVQQ